MSVPEGLADLVGEWRGTSKLWLSPDEPVRESDTTASVTLAAQGKFITIAYTWSYEGDPQDGLIVLSREAKGNAVKAAWIDSWHMGDSMMMCEGGAVEDGAISVRGSYAAPPGPDWGWRIVVEAGDAGEEDAFEVIMYNITPDGDEHLAVRGTYGREK